MQIDAGVLSLVSSLVALIIGGYVLWRLRGMGMPITNEVVTTTIRDAMTAATELTEVAETAVRASEQLWRTGRIEKGDRLDRAFAYVKHWFPYLDQDTIITAIEAAVLVVNSVAAALPEKKKEQGAL
jgi:hypothetical protein